MVSVIVPIYNVEGYLTECLYSIANQTYADLEVICVDDCTMDNSVSIIQEFISIDSRFRLVSHLKNKGLGGARNTGIEQANGEYIVFVDSDDAIAPDMIEKLLSNIQKNQSDVSVCSVLEFYPDGTWVTSSSFHYQKYVSNFCITIDTNEKRHSFTNMWPSASNKLFRAEIIQKYNCRFPEKILYEDHSFYYSYFSHVKKLSYINEPLYYYRKARPGSITSNITGRENEIYKIIEDIKSKFEVLYAGNVELVQSDLMRISYRLLAERNYVLSSNRKEWFKFCKRAYKYLHQKYSFSQLIDNIDTFYNDNDEFYRFMFYANYRRSVSIKEAIKSIPGLKRLIRIILRRGKPDSTNCFIASFVEYSNNPILSRSPIPKLSKTDYFRLSTHSKELYQILEYAKRLALLLEK